MNTCVVDIIHDDSRFLQAAFEFLKTASIIIHVKDVSVTSYWAYGMNETYGTDCFSSRRHVLSHNSHSSHKSHDHKHQFAVESQ